MTRSPIKGWCRRIGVSVCRRKRNNSPLSKFIALELRKKRILFQVRTSTESRTSTSTIPKLRSVGSLAALHIDNHGG
jgi:hypothetical protein